ncbi:MAG: acetoacetate--CoA ligase [Cytophagales bacterium]|nr:acetoacetate--CoA ligase [Cytophagales bacterium]
MASEEVKLLWTPTDVFKEESNLSHYMAWLADNEGMVFENYQQLWSWSVDKPGEFWGSLWNYFDIIFEGEYSTVLQGSKMPHYRWFQGSRLNYAEHIFRNENDSRPAIIHKREGKDIEQISWKELRSKVAALQAFLLKSGVSAGDRVVGYLTNTPEATISLLAANSIGAVWSSCSPDFGVSSVVDRFAQVSPKVLIAVNGYQYGGKVFDKTDVVKEVISALPTVEKVILIDIIGASPIEGTAPWEEIVTTTASKLEFIRVPFEHPMWILYSSGTTGIPKAITHSQGGILMEHLKYLYFHNNVKKGDRCFWYTTTGWMMWNYIQSALLCGGTVVLYDGSPAWPSVDALWQLAEEAKIQHLGASAGYIIANMKEGTTPSQRYDLSALVSVGSTGSPLPPEGFDWIYSHLKKDVWLTSISGGTDVCSAFVGGNPLWPVYSGEIQCRALGCKLEAFDDMGQPVLDEVGEMVITTPMPSMPIYFWNDAGDQRYVSSYFELFEGIWRHGDWIRITPRNGLVIYGRSDATLNRGGVRIGTSEVYRAVDKITTVEDSLIICLEKEGGEYYMPLFVKLQKGVTLSEDLTREIKQTIRNEYTPRHVPDEIIAVDDIPYTISGKKTESPVKKILMGQPLERAVNKDALRNPQAMDFFIKMARSSE